MGADIAIRLASQSGTGVTQLALLDFGPDINLTSANRADVVLRGDRCSYSSSEAYFEILRERHLLATDDVLRRAAAETLRESDGAYHLRWDGRILDGETAPHAQALWSMLGKITCPTLIARAVGSAVLSKQTAAQMARIVPNAALIEIPISGHTVLLDNPEDVTAIVGEFFRSPPARKSRLH
jgi:pimeloyl-ACP methyl ester carboxylesterase